MIKEEIDWFLKKCCEVTKIPKSILEREPTADGELAWMRLERRCEAVLLEIEYRENNNFLNSNKNMGKKKELYLVWQNWGDADSIETKLCGVYDDEQKALELKAELDKKVVNADNCWTIMPKEVYCQWPIIDADGSECEDFEFVSEFSGYTREQRDEQENIWINMVDSYKEAVIETVYMNTEL